MYVHKIIVISLVVLVAACGGGSSSAGGSETWADYEPRATQAITELRALIQPIVSTTNGSGGAAVECKDALGSIATPRGVLEGGPDPVFKGLMVQTFDALAKALGECAAGDSSATGFDAERATEYLTKATARKRLLDGSTPSS